MLKQRSDDTRDLLERVETVPVLNTRVEPVVRIINAALDDDEGSPGGIIINGRIDPATLHFLKVDSSYQRPLGDRPEIFKALKDGVIVPNIDVGVRGQDFSTDGDDILIHSPAYIIDGWQRVGTAKKLIDLVPDHPIRLFATVHFGTDELWERHRFTELNKNICKVSPNLHLRNMRDTNEAVATLYGLSHSQRDFTFHGRVSWSQNMKTGEIISAVQLAKTAMHLHGHLVSLPGGRVEKIAAALGEAAKKVGLQRFRANVATFAEVIEECWGVRSIEIRHGAPQIKGTFLMMLSRMFSTHTDFWDASERAFFVAADIRRKLAKFPINDPHVKGLAASAGAARNILYDLIVNHMNSGKRTHMLRSRYSESAKLNPAWRRD